MRVRQGSPCDSPCVAALPLGRYTAAAVRGAAIRRRRVGALAGRGWPRAALALAPSAPQRARRLAIWDAKASDTVA